MKFSKKIAAVSLAAATGLAFLPAYNPNEKLPESWYKLPEDAHPTQWAALNSGISQAEDTTGASVAVDRFLKANSDALDGLSPESAQNDNKWRMQGFMVDLAVNHTGHIGGLLATGEASALVYWRPARLINAGKNVPQQPSSTEAADLTVTSNTTPEQLRMQLEPIAKSVAATGKVKKTSDFRNNLAKVAEEFLQTTRGIEMNPGAMWDVSRVRLDFSVDAEGHISPFFSKGAGVRLRFEWAPTVVGARLAHAESGNGDNSNSSNLKQLLKTVAQDLSSLPYDEYSPTGLSLKEIRFGLGLYGEGKWGLAKVRSAVMGQVYFSRNTNVAANMLNSADATDTLETLPLVEEAPAQTHIEYADAIGVVHQSFSNNKGGMDTVFEVSREKFRNGLKKASKMAVFLAGRQNKAKKKNSGWDVAEVRTSFALSLSGTTSFVTLSGAKASLELLMQK